MDIQTLKAFPKTSFEAYEPWGKKREHYTGVSIIDLLNYLDIINSVSHIQVIAANDYKIPIKLQDLKQFEYILAYMIDGVILKGKKEFTKKGSIIIAINFDKNKEMDMEIYKSQLVWQVKTIIVE